MFSKLVVDNITGNVLALTLSVCSMSIFSSLFTTHTYATPLPHWMQPCRGSLDSNTELLLPNMLRNVQDSDQLIAHRLWMKANDVTLIATIIRDQMTQERIQSTDLQLFLDENTTLPGFPDHRTHNTETLFTERLQEDYRRVSIASKFVEQMREDEEHSSFSPSYTVRFRHIESQIYPFLCQLKIAVLIKGAQLPYISDEIMHSSLRNVDTLAQRYMRDYRILKDVVRLFRSLQTDYENISSEHREISLQLDDR